MRRWAAFAVMLGLMGAALVTSQRRKTRAPASPEAVLFFLADTQHELSRLPAKFTRMSDEDEINIGNELAKQYLSGWQAGSDDPDTKTVQAYVDRVGARVAGQAQRKLPYRFHYIPDLDFVNAFALPGGHVFIGGGMIALMDSEDELASVLGHEVEHIDHYHCAERAQTEAVLRDIPLGGLVGLPVEVFEAGYSKNQELEADREGTRMAVKAGYSPLGAVRMFQVLEQLYRQHESREQTPQEELSSIAWKTLEGYFRSHPLPSERIAQIQSMISQEHWEGLTNERTLEVAYIFLTVSARRALAAENYAGAEKAAARSIEVKADQAAAVAILAEAEFAQNKFPEAREHYRSLVDKSPQDAGAVAVFANRMALAALNSAQYDQAAKFATASLDLQPNNATALGVLADAQVSLSDFPTAGVTYRKLKDLYPEDAISAINFIRTFILRALATHHYEQAGKVAAFWLTLAPGSREALQFQAQAGLGSGDFATSAKAFRDLLDGTPSDQFLDIRLVWNYADALSAVQKPQEAVQEFEAFMAERRQHAPALDAQIQIEWAGLLLMSGNESVAAELVSRGMPGGQGQIAPEHLIRLAWWYYRAGRYAGAESLLLRLTNVRPGDVSLQYSLGWVELDQNEMDKALVRFRIPGATDSMQWNTPAMGQAIVLWRNHNPDEALKFYDAAIADDPRWLDARLVRTFFSPLVAKTMDELQAEHTKRVEAKRRQR